MEQLCSPRQYASSTIKGNHRKSVGELTQRMLFKFLYFFSFFFFLFSFYPLSSSPSSFGLLMSAFLHCFSFAHSFGDHCVSRSTPYLQLGELSTGELALGKECFPWRLCLSELMLLHPGIHSTHRGGKEVLYSGRRPLTVVVNTTGA
jgi:hypothetical protein